MRYAVTSQLVSNDLPGLIAMRHEQPLEKRLCSRSVPSGLQIDINNLAILVNGPPEIVLLATGSDADFINEESITIAPVFPFQPAGE